MSTLAERLQGASVEYDIRERKIAESIVKIICDRMSDERSELVKLLMDCAGTGAVTSLSLPIKDARLGCEELYISLRRRALLGEALAAQTRHPGISIRYHDKKVTFDWSRLVPQNGGSSDSPPGFPPGVSKNSGREI